MTDPYDRDLYISGSGNIRENTRNVMIYVAIKEIVVDFGLMDIWICQRSLKKVSYAFLTLAEIRQ